MLSKPIILNNFKRSIATNEDYLLNEAKTVKWKPSKNPNAEGWTGKSYPYGAKGDALLTREQFIKKWSERIESWIGVKPDLLSVQEFWVNHSMDFEFVGNDGNKYRIYSPGEGAKSKEYHIQKLKK
jgi:hypothetical protein